MYIVVFVFFSWRNGTLLKGGIQVLWPELTLIVLIHGLRVVVSLITDISETTSRRVMMINIVVLGQSVLVVKVGSSARVARALHA